LGFRQFKTGSCFGVFWASNQAFCPVYELNYYSQLKVAKTQCGYGLQQKRLNRFYSIEPLSSLGGGIRTHGLLHPSVLSFSTLNLAVVVVLVIKINFRKRIQIKGEIFHSPLFPPKAKLFLKSCSPALLLSASLSP